MSLKKNSSHSQNSQFQSKLSRFDFFEHEEDNYLETPIHEMFHSEKIEQLSSDDYL